MNLSVVIPTRDRARLLEACLPAIDAAAEGVAEVEVIVVDDGSEDDTAQVLSRTRLSNAALVTDATGGVGPATARNVGWRRARSPLVLFLGDDIMVDSGLLRRHVENHAHTSPEDVLIGAVRMAPDLPQTRFARFAHEHYQFGVEPPESGRLDWSRFHTANASVRRELLGTVGGFDERFPGAAWEDVELAYRMNAVGARFHYDACAIAYHRHHIAPASYAARQCRSGEAAAVLLDLHPELAGLVRPRRRLPEWVRGVLANRATMAVARRIVEKEMRWLPDSVYGLLCAQFLAHHYYRGLRAGCGRA